MWEWSTNEGDMNDQMFCIDCDHVFPGKDGDECPECGSKSTEALPVDDFDGYYEGDFPSLPYGTERDE